MEKNILKNSAKGKENIPSAWGMGDSKNMLEVFFWGDCRSIAFFGTLGSADRQHSKCTKGCKFCKPYSLYFYLLQYSLKIIKSGKVWPAYKVWELVFELKKQFSSVSDTKYNKYNCSGPLAFTRQRVGY